MRFLLSIVLYVLLAKSPLVYSQASCETTKTPVVLLPIQNVTLDDSVIRRGIPFAIGTPPQNFAAEISIFTNNTIIYTQVNECNQSSPAFSQCLVYHGGFFNPNDSSSWLQASTMTASGAAPEKISSDYPYPADKWGTDVVHLDSNLSLNSLPIDITNQRHWAINAIGLGTNSTVLTYLKIAKVIASASWSMFYGLDTFNTRSQMDGIVVLGGYDRAKATGPNTTASVQMGTSCGTNLLISVLDVKMTSNGASQSLLRTPQLACLDPGLTTIGFSADVFSRFVQNAGGSFLYNSSGLSANALVYEAQGAYSGNLTFNFESGVVITVTSDQLVEPEIVVNDAGVTTADSNTREILVSQLSGLNTAEELILGLPFFTAAYLLVNYDQTPPTFTLWQSNLTTDQDLVALDSDGSECGQSSTTLFPTPSSMPTVQVSTQVHKNTSLSSGAIAGISVSAAAIVVIISSLLLLARKRRQQGRARMDNTALNSTDLYQATFKDSPGELDNTLRHKELPGQPHEVSVELPASREYGEIREQAHELTI